MEDSEFLRYRLLVAHGLIYKLKEHWYFLNEINEINYEIKCRSRCGEFPLMDLKFKLNFIFSAYLNTITALKDGLATTLGAREKTSWAIIVPTHYKIINFYRNATTHDGTMLINLYDMNGNYICGPLVRYKYSEKNKNYDRLEYNPPKISIEKLCVKISQEFIGNFSCIFNGNCDELLEFQSSIQTINVEQLLDSQALTGELRRRIEESKPKLATIFESELNSIVEDINAEISDLEMKLTQLADFFGMPDVECDS